MDNDNHKKLIFLDIDGVLNCEACFKEAHDKWVARGKPKEYKHWNMLDPKHIECLNKIVAETGADIVVSSSWRGDPNLFEVLKAAGVVANFVGITPRLGRPAGASHEYYERGKEIQAWVEANIPAEEEFAYVILEDESDIMPEQIHVKTRWKEGLQQKPVYASISLLNSQRCAKCDKLMKPYRDEIAFKNMGFAWTGHSWTCKCFPKFVLSVG